MNNLPRERKILLGVVAAVVVLCALFGIAGTAFVAGTMAGSARANYGVQSYGPPPLPGNRSDAQGDVVPAPQQRDTLRPGPRMMAGPGWHRGGPFGFFGGILRFIGTILFIGFIIFLVRGLFFRRWGWRGGMGRGPWGHRGHWGGPWGGPGQGNSGVPPHFDDAQRGPAAPGTTTPETKPADPDKPQNPDAL